MVLVPQDRLVKIGLVMKYVSEKSGAIARALNEEPNSEGKLDATYLSGLDAQEKQDASDMIAMLRWIVDDLSVTVPDAYTDPEVDAIDPNIRQKEE